MTILLLPGNREYHKSYMMEDAIVVYLLLAKTDEQ